MENNIALLKNLINQTLFDTELSAKGFYDPLTIASNSIIENPLFGKVTYHSKTFYTGITLEVEYNRFYILQNNLSQPEADLKNYIRDLEYQILGLNNTIFAYRFEFNDNNTALKFEEEKIELQKILNDLKLL
jgi:hypothetical protein